MLIYAHLFDHLAIGDIMSVTHFSKYTKITFYTPYILFVTGNRNWLSALQKEKLYWL